MSLSSSTVPTVTLSDGEQLPQLGFGVFQIPPAETAEVATRALLAGYRHIDTAAAYRNEAGVGQAVHAAGLQRDDVYITTKCFNDDHGFAQAKRALHASLKRLEMEHRARSGHVRPAVAAGAVGGAAKAAGCPPHR